MNTVSARTFNTNRFKVRLVDEIDANDLFEICSDERVTRYLTFEPYKHVGETKRVIVNMIRAYLIDECVNFAIINKLDNKMIGSISITYNKYDKGAELGYLINYNYQNEHVLSECLEVFIKECFEHYKLDYIYANVVSLNKKSIHILKKFNFERIESLNSKYNIHGEMLETEYYKLSKEKFYHTLKLIVNN